LIFGCYTLQHLGIMALFPSFLKDRFHLPAQDIGQLDSIAMTSNILGNVAAGFLLQRGFSRSFLMFGALLVMALCGLGIFSLNLPWQGSFVFAFVLCCVGGIVPGCVLASVPLFSGTQVAAVNGLVVQGSNLGIVLGPLLISSVVARYSWSPSRRWLPSSTFPTLGEMKEGLGDILLNFEADVPHGDTNRRLTFENHHQSAISVYLVNCLLPSDPNVRVTAQDRNYDQSFYQLDYAQAGVRSTSPSTGSWPSLRGWLDQTGSGSLFKAFFYHGVRHILTGYDHLLFIGALVLAANTFWELVKVVTAFTLAHTITLTLAAFDLVHLPQQVIEPLISASIVFVALQNVFWPGRTTGWSRLGVAFFFGLFHGLGFAGKRCARCKAERCCSPSSPSASALSQAIKWWCCLCLRS
jgi:hypothetical protein